MRGEARSGLQFINVRGGIYDPINDALISIAQSQQYQEDALIDLRSHTLVSKNFLSRFFRLITGQSKYICQVAQIKQACFTKIGRASQRIGLENNAVSFARYFQNLQKLPEHSDELKQLSRHQIYQLIGAVKVGKFVEQEPENTAIREELLKYLSYELVSNNIYALSEKVLEATGIQLNTDCLNRVVSLLSQIYFKLDSLEDVKALDNALGLLSEAISNFSESADKQKLLDSISDIMNVIAQISDRRGEDYLIDKFFFSIAEVFCSSNVQVITDSLGIVLGFSSLSETDKRALDTQGMPRSLIATMAEYIPEAQFFDPFLFFVQEDSSKHLLLVSGYDTDQGQMCTKSLRIGLYRDRIKKLLEDIFESKMNEKIESLIWVDEIKKRDQYIEAILNEMRKSGFQDLHTGRTAQEIVQECLKDLKLNENEIEQIAIEVETLMQDINEAIDSIKKGVMHTEERLSFVKVLNQSPYTPHFRFSMQQKEISDSAIDLYIAGEYNFFESDNGSLFLLDPQSLAKYETEQKKAFTISDESVNQLVQQTKENIPQREGEKKNCAIQEHFLELDEQIKEKQIEVTIERKERNHIALTYTVKDENNQSIQLVSQYTIPLDRVDLLDLNSFEKRLKNDLLRLKASYYYTMRQQLPLFMIDQTMEDIEKMQLNKRVLLIEQKKEVEEYQKIQKEIDNLYRELEGVADFRVTNRKTQKIAQDSFLAFEGKMRDFLIDKSGNLDTKKIESVLRVRLDPTNRLNVERAMAILRSRLISRLSADLFLKIKKVALQVLENKKKSASSSLKFACEFYLDLEVKSMLKEIHFPLSFFNRQAISEMIHICSNTQNNEEKLHQFLGFIRLIRASFQKEQITLQELKNEVGEELYSFLVSNHMLEVGKNILEQKDIAILSATLATSLFHDFLSARNQNKLKAFFKEIQEAISTLKTVPNTQDLEQEILYIPYQMFYMKKQMLEGFEIRAIGEDKSWRSIGIERQIEFDEESFASIIRFYHPQTQRMIEKKISLPRELSFKESELTSEDCNLLKSIYEKYNPDNPDLAQAIQNNVDGVANKFLEFIVMQRYSELLSDRTESGMKTDFIKGQDVELNSLLNELIKREFAKKEIILETDGGEKKIKNLVKEYKKRIEEAIDARGCLLDLDLDSRVIDKEYRLLHTLFREVPRGDHTKEVVHFAAKGNLFANQNLLKKQTSIVGNSSRNISLLPFSVTRQLSFSMRKMVTANPSLVQEIYHKTLMQLPGINPGDVLQLALEKKERFLGDEYDNLPVFLTIERKNQYVLVNIFIEKEGKVLSAPIKVDLVQVLPEEKLSRVFLEITPEVIERQLLILKGKVYQEIEK